MICNSRFTATSLERADPGARRAVVLPPVAPPDPSTTGIRSRLRASLGADDRSTVIALVGRMEAWKGHEALIHALAAIADRRDWQAWIIGGPQRPAEVSYLGSLGLATARLGLVDRVRFLGERTDVRELLASADLYCQPNTAPEPFGITFVEALYAGLPVVTFDLGGPAEIVDETCGVLVPPGDQRELAVVLRRLIGDPAERARLARHAPQRASALCDPSVQVPRIAELLRGAR
jgi:glycosyltransferase involved in cell wall biosynthesis